MQYKINNPSDPYTFLAESREVAALVILLLGPAYGATPESGEKGVPIFMLGGATEWYEGTFGRTPDEGVKALGADVADALESVMLGSFEDRRRYTAALEAIDDPEKRRRFMEEWQDGRTSMNNIGKRCHDIARAIRNVYTAKGGGES
ncbi:MAG: hypothetical protein FWE08_03715 [Oscillospiraceae bacterium]|nr:hypothetical protein [Oscillospiraceae bacterium]